MAIALLRQEKGTRVKIGPQKYPAPLLIMSLD